MIKLLLLINIIIHVQLAFGQTSNPSKIIFRYDKGHYSFGDPGQYAITEIIEYCASPNYYTIAIHLQLKKRYDTAAKKVIVDSAYLSINNKRIAKSKVDKLFVELNTSRNNFSASFIQSKIKKITKKEVLNTAKNRNDSWMFEEDYSDKEDQRVAFRQMRRFYNLDSFINKQKPDTSNDLIMIDVWNRLSITELRGTDTTEYRSELYQLLGQPIIRYDNRNYTNAKKVINLESFLCIKALVPKQSVIKKAVDLSQIKNDYIHWYLNHEW